MFRSPSEILFPAKTISEDIVCLKYWIYFAFKIDFEIKDVVSRLRSGWELCVGLCLWLPVGIEELRSGSMEQYFISIMEILYVAKSTLLCVYVKNRNYGINLSPSVVVHGRMLICISRYIYDIHHTSAPIPPCLLINKS